MEVSVSVIVPVYNSAKTIGRCLKGLLNQTCPANEYEIIVVDDGSNDATGYIVKSFDVRYIRKGKAGPAAARNEGAKRARGEILLFTDSDCVPNRDWVEKMTDSLKKKGVVGVKGAYITGQKSIVARFSQLEFEERYKMLEKAESIDMVDTHAGGYRKDVFMKMGGFDASFPVANNEDTELSYRMSNSGYKMIFNSSAIVSHLNHPDAVVKYAKLKFWRGYWRAVVYRKIPNKMLRDTYTPKTLKLQILSLFAFVGSIFLALLFPGSGVLLPSFLAVVFCLLSLSFTMSALKKDILVGILSPLMLVVRAFALGLGSLWGFARPPKTNPARNAAAEEF